MDIAELAQTRGSTPASTGRLRLAEIDMRDVS